MLYIHRLIIPANTAESAKEQTAFRLPKGTLSKVEIAFPPGPKGLTHAQVYHNEFQLFPGNLDESYRWDDYTVVWEGEYDLPEAWNQLSIRGWNLDDTYEHEVTGRFQITGRAWDLRDLQTLPLEW